MEMSAIPQKVQGLIVIFYKAQNDMHAPATALHAGAIQVQAKIKPHTPGSYIAIAIDHILFLMEF